MKIASWTLAVLLGFAAQASAQDNVLFLNARPAEEHRSCVAPRAWVSSNVTCPLPPLWIENYFVQGHRVEMQVVNRKFLTDYSVSIDGVTQLQTGPNIRGLNEAENLTLGPASFASLAVAKGGTEGLTARTATQILFQLVDETTSSQPKTDLDADFAVIQREQAKVQSQVADFARRYQSVLEIPFPPAPEDDCNAVIGAPSVIPLQTCLDDEGDADPVNMETEGEFRDANTRVQDLIAAVRTLGSQLASADLPNKLSTVATAIAQYQSDLNIFRGNVQAASDAVDLVRDQVSATRDTFRTQLRRQEMKGLLLDKLKGSDSKPTLDEAEMNRLLDLFSASEVANRGPQAADQNIDALGGTVSADRGNIIIYASSGTDFNNSLATFRLGMSDVLPDALNDLNQSQGKLLGKMNLIYDDSVVPDPLVKQIDISGHSGNLLVYYTIRRIETFQRYTVTQVQGPGGPGPTVADAMALPPAKGATAGAQPAPNANANPGAAPANGSAPPAQTASDANQGIVVAKGVFQVHDVFHANVVGAFAFSTLKNQSITAQAQPQACTGTTAAPDPNCFAPFVSSGHKWTPIVGLDYYFQPRDTYPRTGRPWLCRQRAWQCFGVMGAASVTEANNYFLGGFFEPALGVQFGAGANFGTETVLQSPYTPGTAVDITGNFPTYGKRSTGFFISAGLDIGIFRKVFGKVTGIGTAATGTAGN